MNHDLLIKKLFIYGIRGTANAWLNNYLTNRNQYVIADGHSSGMRLITCGVPQGSVLGPVLFLLYINDICNVSNLLKFVLFADDTNDNFWQAISVFMFQGECTVNLNNLFSKPSTPNLTWTNPRQSFLGNYDYASHFTYDNSSVSVRFHFLVCCSITFRCIVVDSGNMLLIQVKGTHG